MSKLDNIKVPSNLREVTKDTIEKGKALKRIKKLKKLKIAGVLILAVSTSLVVINPSLANSIFSLNGFFDSLPSSYGEYAQNINITKTVGDVSLTINDVVCDGSTINFVYTIKSKNKLPRKTSKTKIDGVNESVANYEFLMLDTKVKVKNGIASTQGGSHSEYIDDYTYQGMLSYNLIFKDFKVPDTIKMNISVKSISIYDTDIDKINGPFNFDINVKPNVKKETIDVKETKDGITVDSIELTDQSLKVNVSFPKKFLDNSKKEWIISPIEPSITFDTKYSVDLYGKTYSDPNMITNNYFSRFGKVYDSIIIDNIYNLSEIPNEYDEYIVIKFSDFNTASDDDTEFKVYLEK